MTASNDQENFLQFMRFHGCFTASV